VQCATRQQWAYLQLIDCGTPFSDDVAGVIVVDKKFEHSRVIAYVRSRSGVGNERGCCARVWRGAAWRLRAARTMFTKASVATQDRRFRNGVREEGNAMCNGCHGWVVSRPQSEAEEGVREKHTKRRGTRETKWRRWIDYDVVAR